MFDYSEALSAVVLGKHLGSGAFRDVYECRLDDSIVIKIAKDHEGAFHNAKEWEYYWDISGIKGVGKWLCPVVMISNDNRILVMKRAYPVRKSEMPKSIPKFCTDIKIDNFGLYDGRVVMVDYGYIDFDVSTKKKKLKL